MRKPAGRIRRLSLVLIGVASCLPLVLPAGCGKKEEPTAPGYYTGPMVKKGATPAPGRGGTTQPGADIN